MANIRIDLNHTPFAGEAIKFKAPCDAKDITGLTVYYVTDANEITSKEFTLTDANGGDIGAVDNIFSTGAIVKVILDTDANNAFVQNPDTNTYLERRFEGKANKEHTHTADSIKFENGDTIAKETEVKVLEDRVENLENNGSGVTPESIGAAKIRAANDMLHNGNEFTFVPSGYTGQIYINHQTAGGANGNITNYYFGNGKGGLATFVANYFKGKFQGDSARPIYNNEEAAMLSDVPTNAAQIGAAAASHTHGAAQITSGVFSATDIKAKAGTDYTYERLRNASLNAAETPPSENGAIAWTYE